jgi:hypothetical protein
LEEENGEERSNPMPAPIAGDPVNTYTVNIFDTVTHVIFAGINARSKNEAVRTVANIADQAVIGLVPGNTWTYTVTQP